MFSIDNILAYQHWKSNFGVDDDLSPIPLSGGYNQPDALELERGAAGERQAGGHHQPRGRRLLTSSRKPITISYQDLRYINAVIPNVGSLGVFPLQFIQPDQTPAQSKAAFANINWEIIPGLTFDGGLRYTDESKEYHYFRLNPDGTINPYLDPLAAATAPATRARHARHSAASNGRTAMTTSRPALTARCQVQGQPVGLARGAQLPLLAGSDGLREHLHRLQGRRHQPAAVLRQSGDPLRSRSAHQATKPASRPTCSIGGCASTCLASTACCKNAQIGISTCPDGIDALRGADQRRQRARKGCRGGVHRTSCRRPQHRRFGQLPRLPLHLARRGTDDRR